MAEAERKAILLGGGGHARVLLDCLQQSGIACLVGYTDPKQQEAMPLPYLGDDRAVYEYGADEICLVNGIGSVELPTHREKIYARFTADGYGFLTVVHPRTILSPGVTLGNGVQVMPGAVINTGSTIHENCILNTSVTVDHDCTVGPHSHLAPGVTLSGGVTIGRGCHIGIGATVIQGVTIGDCALVGAGSLVLANIPPRAKAFGSPARVKGRLP